MKQTKPAKTSVKYSALPERIRENLSKFQHDLARYYGSEERASKAIESVSNHIVKDVDKDENISLACGKLLDKIPNTAAMIAGLDLNLTLYNTLNPTSQHLAGRANKYNIAEAITSNANEKLQATGTPAALAEGDTTGSSRDNMSENAA